MEMDSNNCLATAFCCNKKGRRGGGMGEIFGINNSWNSMKRKSYSPNADVDIIFSNYFFYNAINLQVAHLLQF